MYTYIVYNIIIQHTPLCRRGEHDKYPSVSRVASLIALAQLQPLRLKVFIRQMNTN